MLAPSSSDTAVQSPLEAVLNQNKQLESVVNSLTLQLKSLTDELAWYRKQIFGQKAERFVKSNEQELTFPFYEKMAQPASEPSTEPAKPRAPRQRAGDPPSYAHLPVETILVDVPEKDRVCAVTGKVLAKVGEHITEKIAYLPGSHFLKRYVRPIYGSTASDEGKVCAELPDSILPRCMADNTLLADIIVRKFSDHLPLHRIAEIYAREGVAISKQNMCNWVTAIGQALKPLHDAMRREILLTPSVHIDETPIDMLDPGRKKTATAYMWVLATADDPPNIYYEFQDNRRHSNAENLLKGYTGVVHSDKYGAYEQLASKGKHTWCPCWAHVRRKFFEAESGDLAFRTWILDKIQELFMHEREALPLDETSRMKLRAELEAPIVAEILSRCQERLVHGNLLPKAKFREALGYTVSLSSYLGNYLKHPRARMDNNVAERAIRPFAIGRKNWLFVGNQKAGESAAVLASLVQSCRARSLDPRTYIEDILARFMSHPISKLAELLPSNWTLLV